jgi:cytochrome c oxidase subunit 1
MAQMSQNIGSTPLEKISLGLAILGTILILLPALLDRGEPTLNNYIPIIIDPIYYTGLTLLMLDVLGGISPILMKTAAEPNLKGPACIFVIAIIAFTIAMIQLADQPLNHDYNERLTWGGGHILQCLNVTLLLVAWSYLADVRQSNTPFKLAVAWLVIASLVGIIFYTIWPILDERQTKAFTHLKKILGPSVLIFAVILLPALSRNFKKFNWQDPAMLSLWTSIILFSSGGVLGFFVDGADTRTPAHYHGVIGGINLAFVGLFYTVFLPQLGRPVPAGKLITSQIILYSVGQFLFILGMFIAGSMGAARKVMGTAIDMNSFIAVAAARIRDFGGGLAIIGGILFIYVALRALLCRPSKISS